MPTPTEPTKPDVHAHPYRALVLRGVISGVLMGLANLVPGVSAGAVLLATGIFAAFLSAIAELATFRWKVRSLVLLGSVGIGWVSAVLLGAGVVKGLVIEYRWIMYSLFIGLTLGGVPLIWSATLRSKKAFWGAAVIGLALMATLGVLQMRGLGDVGGSAASVQMLVLGGLLAAGATVLPGGSGTYVLLLMGLYVPILTAVDLFKDGLVEMSFAALLEQGKVLVPFAAGMGLGLVSVSLLTKWSLAKFPAATAGLLLGLLVGSVVGLWPFQQGVQPIVGDVVKGRVMTAELIAQLKADDWPVKLFAPTAVQVMIAIVLAVVALVMTVAITRLEARLEKKDHVENEGSGLGG